MLPFKDQDKKRHLNSYIHINMPKWCCKMLLLDTQVHSKLGTGS